MFFFFKQKTAYEIASCLVGSEMCIRDRFCGGFTTMSAFVYEISQYIQDKEFFFASGYFAVTLAGAGLAFLAGLVLSAFLVR